VLNESVAYDKIPVISVLYCNIYLAFKILIKFCSPWWKVLYQQNRKDCIIVCRTHAGINASNLWCPGHNDSLQHDAHNQVYGIVVFCDH